MSGQDCPSPDIFDLVHDFVTASRQNDLSDVEVADFQRLLRDNPKVARVYVRYLETTIMVPRLLAELEIGDVSSVAKLPIPTATELPSPDARRRRASVFLAIFAARAGVSSETTRCCSPSSPHCCLWERRRWCFPGAGTSRRPSPFDRRGPLPRSLPRRRFVARLTAADCQWVDPESAIGEGTLLIAGQKLELASGHVHIVFQSGAEVKLHGPAIFEIQSANSSFLTIGRLSARAATPESHGFTVHSRTAATVDLGIEFNVIASDDGHSQIGVVEGAVEVQLANGRHAPPGRGRVHRGRAGHAVGHRADRAGRGTPAFKFPTIEPPSNKDYADASQGHAHISVLRGRPMGATSAAGPSKSCWTARGNLTPTRPSSRFSSRTTARD